MDAPDTKTACREVIQEWGTLSKLVGFAVKRHGYGNSDGGFGVMYPEDLDEYNIHVQGIRIPAGMLLLYGHAFANPPGYEILVSETEYLRNLIDVLWERGLIVDAEKVTLLLKMRRGTVPCDVDSPAVKPSPGL